MKKKNKKISNSFDIGDLVQEQYEGINFCPYCKEDTIQRVTLDVVYNGMVSICKRCRRTVGFMSIEDISKYIANKQAGDKRIQINVAEAIASTKNPKIKREMDDFKKEVDSKTKGN